MTKKKNEDIEVAMNAAEMPDTEDMDDVSEILAATDEVPAEAAESPPKKKRASKKKTEEPAEDISEELLPPPDAVKPQKTKAKESPILTIEIKDDVETEEDLAEKAWHEIHNSYRTRRILTGMLGGVEQLDNGKTVAVVDYKGYRIIIPLKEMSVNFPNNATGNEYRDLIIRHHKLVSNMLGADIDFIVKGVDEASRSVVASRRDAMLKKRQTFYMDIDSGGTYQIYDGRIVQARVIAVAEKAIRIEAFGVECSIMARDLSWDWIGDAHERFSVGDEILVRIQSVNRESLEMLSIKADVKTTSENNKRANLNQCRVQSKYAGKVTDINKGVVFIRLSNGVNAIAHSCYDRRTPGKKDDVSFAVTHIDEERGVAVGIITRIIKQHL